MHKCFYSKSNQAIALFSTLGILLAGCGTGDKPVFKVLDGKKTGINFENKLTQTDDINILDYLYFYNGGGVAAGDVNNDGLSDLYFVSTQGDNKLYLNKGKSTESPFQFEDVTTQAGVKGKANWQTGVTMVDVNGDGKLDIYVCAVGKYKSLKGKNELYINLGNDVNGVPKFAEKAADYGLDFSGFSTQTAFFDYDKDGDLDAYLLTHATHSVSSYDKVSARSLTDSTAGDVLYRNDNGKFVDVSQQAGVYQAPMGYGLGISVADFNNDGWDDIFVANDFHEDDYYYLNNQNGGFIESTKTSFKHLSKYTMGCDAADMNNDGWVDIFTADMQPDDEKIEKSSLGEDALDVFMYKLQLGFYYQYSRNSLHLNMQGQRFAEIGTLAGVSATDWSWSPLIADFDNDGQRDLFVSNGIPKRPNDLDYIKYINSDSTFNILSGSPLYGTKSKDKSALELMPDGKVHNYIFKGNKDYRYQDQSKAWGFEAETVSNGAIYADFDNDGDLEIVTNNLNQPAGFYQNMAQENAPETSAFVRIKLEGNGMNTAGFGAKVILKQKGLMQVVTQQPTRGFESSSEPVLHFGLEKSAAIDSLIVIWPNQKMQVLTNVKPNQTLTVKQSDAQIDARTYNYTPIPTAIFSEITQAVSAQHTENQYFEQTRESLMPFKVSTEGARTTVGDVNGDGLQDFYLGGARDKPGQLLLQQANGKFVASKQVAFERDSIYEDVDALFFDADRDGDADLYVVTGGNEFFGTMPELNDRLYLNDGKGQFSRAAANLPAMTDNKSCVAPADFDQDGDIDLFVGGRVVGYKYGENPKSYLLVNDGKGRFEDKTDQIAPQLRNIGMTTAATWADTDNDKDMDLVVVGDWMPISIFENQAGKTLASSVKNGDLANKTGFWHAIEAADFDGDGDVDFMVGNLGLNNRFIKQAEPALKMYVKDFDGNGSTEQVLAYKRDDKWYPLNGKDELGKQMPGIINKRFTTYKDFAGKTLEQVFKADELEGSTQKTVNTFESVYVENRGKDGFVATALPREAQFSKVFAITAGDFDGDGKLDAICGGNFYGVSTYQGRYDASFGWFLKGNGKGQFTAVWPTNCGLMLDGELRDLKKIDLGNQKAVLGIFNNQRPQVFRYIVAKKPAYEKL